MTELTPTFPSSRAEALKTWEGLLESGERASEPTAFEMSGLSAAFRYRLLCESEAAASLFRRYNPSKAEPLLKQLCARDYWRGWSEGRPQVYLAYLRARDDDRRRFTGTQTLAVAEDGRTGLLAFDEWNRQMIETGWLPQQARLWYASIWIFTLRLPWTLGAAHFASHLVDLDPASAVLLWRSVAGLHLGQKPYVAKAAEIAKWSKGRYDLTGHLNERPVALTGPALPAPRFQEFPSAPSRILGDRYALLVTPEDLSPETSAIGSLKPSLVLLTGCENLDKNTVWSPLVKEYLETILGDAAARLAQHFDCPVERLAPSQEVGESIASRLRTENLPHLVYQQPSIGPWQEMLSRATFKDVGLKYFPLRRNWDSKLWPSATRTLLDFQDAVKPRLVKSQGTL